MVGVTFARVEFHGDSGCTYFIENDNYFTDNFKYNNYTESIKKII